MFAQPYIPFTGHMFLEFLVIALLDQHIQNWNKMGGHMKQRRLPWWMQYALDLGELCFFVVRLRPQNRRALHLIHWVHVPGFFW
jgi:hypothetical protein